VAASVTTTIINAAGAHLGHHHIEDIAGSQQPFAKEANVRLQLVRDGLLRAYPWNFAMVFASLPEDKDRPAHTYNHAYSLPLGGSDKLPAFLRLWSVEGEGAYEVSQNKIYSNIPAPLKVRYIGRTEPANDDAMFSEILALELAIAVGRITGNDETRIDLRRLQSKADNLKKMATRADGMERSRSPVVKAGGGFWLDQRNTGRSTSRW